MKVENEAVGTAASIGGDRLEAQLVELVRSSPMLMRALRAARTVNPPDWLIGAGVVRDLVWNHLHGFQDGATTKDVDLVFFDPDARDGERAQGVLEALRTIEPGIPWDVTNQATVHQWYPEVFGVDVEPLVSSADAVGTWPETATSIALRLHQDDTIELVAPCALEDLFGLICRRNPRRVTVEEYQRRIVSKRIMERWPGVLALRVASEDDIARVLALWETAGGSESVSDTNDGVQRLLDRDPGALLLAETTGEVVGTLIAAWDGWRGSFYKLVVSPDHRRHGLARELVREGEQRLRTLGAVRLTAIVADENPAAMSFWRAAGYQQQEHRARFIREVGS
jgi:hypothetical protein